jgi:8-oxo-dGTP pyrophosphatase MutT (NUDIX family)
MNPDDRDLNFDILETKTLLATRVFDLQESRRRGPGGTESQFVLVHAPDWANVVAVVPDEMGRDCFLMVRQFRHGIGRAVWEFPGGMVDQGEDPAGAAARELEEETGWKAGSLTFLGATSPNPSFMTNHVSTFRADGLTPTGRLHLDDHEFVRVGLRPVDEVLAEVGEGEYDHGVMLMALWFWRRDREQRS